MRHLRLFLSGVFERDVDGVSPTGWVRIVRSRHSTAKLAEASARKIRRELLAQPHSDPFEASSWFTRVNASEFTALYDPAGGAKHPSNAYPVMGDAR